MSQNPPLSVAIVGTGIAGCTAAYALSRYGGGAVSVDAVYEARDRPGLHANSVTLDAVTDPRTNAALEIDVPLRAVSPHYYHNLMALYADLGIALEHVDYSSVGLFWRAGTPFMRHHNVLVCGFAIPYIPLRDLLNPLAVLRSLRIVLEVLWFVFTGPFYLRDPATLRGVSLGEFLRRHRYSYDFTHLFLYPAMSTLLSCSYEQVDRYPADSILGFYCSRHTTILTGWYRVRGGVKVVSERLLQHVEKSHILLGTPIASIRREDGRVVITDNSGNSRTFDRVIIATEPNLARRIWSDPSDEEREMLARVDHFDADISLHRDPLLMPPQRSDWKGLNYFCRERNGPSTDPTPSETLEPGSTGSPSASMTTAFLNPYYKGVLSAADGSPLAAQQPELFESWNSYAAPAAGTEVCATRMTRAVWRSGDKEVFMHLLPRLKSSGGVLLAGSYCAEGITLLEQAVTSGCTAATALGAVLPFDVRPAYEARWWTLMIAHALVAALAVLGPVLRLVTAPFHVLQSLFGVLTR